MRVAFDLFRGDATEEDLAQLATKSGTPGEFYALLYLGLYAEARKEMDKARNCTYMSQRLCRYIYTLFSHQILIYPTYKYHCLQISRQVSLHLMARQGVTTWLSLHESIWKWEGGRKGKPHRNKRKNKKMSRESKRKKQVQKQVNDGDDLYLCYSSLVFTFTSLLSLLLSMLLPLAAAVLSPAWYPQQPAARAGQRHISLSPPPARRQRPSSSSSPSVAWTHAALGVLRETFVELYKLVGK